MRLYQESDRGTWLRMRAALWPGASVAQAEDDARAWLARPDTVVIVVEISIGSGSVGFAEAGERAYADGCKVSPVAYLEGWFVKPEFRGRGLGPGLVRAVERWARERGYVELASDCLLENTRGQAAHRAAGFQEVERSVKYRKSLAASV